MEPDIDDPLSEGQNETLRRFYSERLGDRTPYSYDAGTPRYVPFYVERLIKSCSPLKPDPGELSYDLKVEQADILLFPELDGRREVRLSFCEDGEVYELPERCKPGTISVEPAYIHSLLDSVVRGAATELREQEILDLVEHYYNQFLAEVA